MQNKCIICHNENHYKLKFCEKCFKLVSDNKLDDIARIQWKLWHVIKNKELDYNNAIFLNVHRNVYLKRFFRDISANLTDMEHYLKTMQEESVKEGTLYDLDFLKVVANIVALNAYQ
jgi:hypothetical protein